MGGAMRQNGPLRSVASLTAQPGVVRMCILSVPK